MREEVKKFWENKGYSIISGEDFSRNGGIHNTNKIFYIFIKTSESSHGYYGYYHWIYDQETNIYYFENKEYSEEAMLKLIKLKAFL